MEFDRLEISISKLPDGKFNVIAEGVTGDKEGVSDPFEKRSPLGTFTGQKDGVIAWFAEQVRTKV